MFDYDGDLNASFDDYRDLLEKVICEAFPNGDFQVRIRKTKAMAKHKISISIKDGPMNDDLIAAVPLLRDIFTGTRWVHCGKVLPELGYWVRQAPRSPVEKLSTYIWELMLQDDADIRSFCAKSKKHPSRIRLFAARHEKRLRTLIRGNHPAQASAAMALIAAGGASNVEQIATEQRRDELARVTPMPAAAVAAAPARRTRL